MGIEELGFTRDEILDKVVERAYESIFGRDIECDQDWVSDRVEKEVKKNFQKSVDSAVDRIGEQLVGPRIEEYIRNSVLQKTTRWGEKDGAPISFTEYLVSRAHEFCEEEVDFNGITKSQSNDSYSWRRYGTRVATMIDKYLHLQIKGAVEKILADANSQLAGGILAAVKLQLEEVGKRLTIRTEIK